MIICLLFELVYIRILKALGENKWLFLKKEQEV